MLKTRLLFPAVYIVFFVPTAVGFPMAVKVAVLVLCPSLALAINFRPAARLAGLLLTAFGTLVPFLILVQAAVCSSSATEVPTSLLFCIIQKALTVLLNVSVLSAVFTLAAANEWRGSLLATINGMCLPRSIRMVAIISGAMIGEFRRAMIRVHHAFTARGEAMPSLNWRNLMVLPTMLGSVWASVLIGVVYRFKGQWSSDTFWARYVPQNRQPGNLALSDLAVLSAAGIVIGISLTTALRH